MDFILDKYIVASIVASAYDHWAATIQLWTKIIFSGRLVLSMHDIIWHIQNSQN